MVLVPGVANEMKSVLSFPFFPTHTKGRLAFIEKATTLVSDLSISMQIKNPNLHSLIAPHSTVLTDWNCVSWFVVMEPLWLVKMQMRV